MREIWSWSGLLVMLAICGAAWRWGGGLERRVAVLTLVAWTAMLAAQTLTRRAAPWPHLVVMDVLVFVVLLALVRRRVSAWAVCALAAQGVALAVHAIRAFSPAMSSWSYLTALAVASYGFLLSLAWGTWSHHRSHRLS